MNITLSLKPVYYKLIEGGIKKTEYRLLNEYYSKRLVKDGKIPSKGDKPDYKDIDTVTFLSGGLAAMTYKVKGIRLWPSSNPTHFAIDLGERIKTK